MHILKASPKLRETLTALLSAHHSQFGEAELVLFKYVVSTFSHILALHILRNYFQNCFFYRISRD